MLKTIVLYIVSLSLLFQPVSLLAQSEEEINFYTVTQTELDKTQTGVGGNCLSCWGDTIGGEIRNLKIMVCEELMESLKCEDKVGAVFLRDCNEETEDDFALGERIAGCLAGSLINIGINAAIGIVLGMIIAAITSTPIGLIAAGATAAGTAYLYLSAEYHKAASDPNREKSVMLQMLGSMGSSVYQLFFADYECYNPMSRAWQICGLIGIPSGGVFTTAAGLGTRDVIKNFSVRQLMQKTIGGKLTNRQLRALKSAQGASGRLLDNSNVLEVGILENRSHFLRNLINLRKADIKISDVEKVVSTNGVLAAGKQKKVQAFFDSLREVAKATGRLEGFRSVDLENLLQSQNRFRAGFSIKAKTIDPDSIENGLEPLRKSGFNNNEIMTILNDDNVLDIAPEARRAAVSYIQDK